MSHTRRSRHSPRSPSPYHRSRYSISLSRSPSRSRRSRSRSRSCDHADVVNPGNNLYVTGLSSQVSKAELEDHFASKGKVVDIHLVVDPYTRESRGFGFVTMARIEDAERCIKHLDGSILNGRIITVEKAKRGRGRTPTPGRYLGLRKISDRRRRSPSSPYSYRRSRYSSSLDRERSYSLDRERSYSPCYYRRISPSYRRSPIRRRRSDSPSASPYYSSRSPSPRASSRRRISPAFRRRYRRSYSRSISPRRRSYRRYRSRSPSHTAASNKMINSRESYSHSRSFRSRSVSSSSVRSG